MLSQGLIADIDEMSLPKGWTHDQLMREAHQTGERIRGMFKKSGMIVLGPGEVEHLTSLLGYLARHNIAYRDVILPAETEETVT